MNDALLAITTLTTGLPANWPERAAWLLVEAIVGGTAALLVIGATYWVSRRRARRARPRRGIGAFN